MADKHTQVDERANRIAACARRQRTTSLTVGGRDFSSLLVVDDNEMNRDMLSRRLRRHGYHVTTAAGGAEAIECLARSSFDAILLDIMMPVINGWEELNWIRQRHSREQLLQLNLLRVDIACTSVRLCLSSPILYRLSLAS